MSEQGTTSLVGTLVKVLLVDLDASTFHFRLPDGRVGRVTGYTNLRLMSPGDVVLLGDSGWEPAPNQIWPDSNSIAIVRRILEDGAVLLDNGLSLTPVRNDRAIAIEQNNTVEYNPAEGILRLIAPEPIRSRDSGLEVEDVRKEFRVGVNDTSLTFADFGGYPHVIERAKELIETQLEQRAKLERIGARPVKGVLFTGPPGTGKTHLARIIAHESRAEFYLISGPSVVTKWLGDTEETLRRIFEAATTAASGRAIIFFDEIDSIAERRTGESHEASKRLVAQLLTLMDGFDDDGNSVVVIAATNRVETLDPALTRPGRFDWEIEFGLPTLEDRMQVLLVGERALRTKGNLPLAKIAALSDGWSAAELNSLWTEAALVAAGDGRAFIGAEDVALAYERVSLRPRRSNQKGA